MGLHVHNLGNLPADTEREYFIYMLDYDWRATADAVILEPNISGIGIDLKKLFGFGS